MVRDIIEWDVRNWSKCLPFWVPALQKINPSCARVLALGERNGGLSLWFALQGYCVVCSDFRGPTARARELHQEYGVADQITYADVDVFRMPFEAESFDVVACKSVIGGLKLVYGDPSTRTLENQATAVSEIHRVLKHRGVFCGAENLQGTVCHRVLRHCIKRGQIRWRHLTPGEIKSLFRAFEQVNCKTYGFLGTQFTFLGLDFATSIVDSWLSCLVPSPWR